MITIILAICLGIIFTILASENNQQITLNLFGTGMVLPLYIILVLSFLAGTLVTSIFSFFDWTFTAFDLRKKESNYNSALKINESLRKDITKLNEENVVLKEELNTFKSEQNEKRNLQRKENIKNFFRKIAHPGSATSSQMS